MKHLYLLLFLLVSNRVIAQEDYYQPKKQSVPTKPTYTILLKDGTQLRGELVRQDSIEAVVRTRDLGEVRLRADQIVSMEQQGAQADGAIYPNQFAQTMRLAPTAFSAEKGRLYYRNYIVYFSQFEYGITDNWSVGTTFFTFVPIAVFSLSTKVSFPVSDRVRLGVSGQYIGIRSDGFLFGGGRGSIQGAGYLQGIVTTGDRQNNTTFGLGWGVSNGELTRTVVGSFGLVRKVSPKLSFITENFVLLGRGTVDFGGMLSAGIRFDRRRHAFDLAAYVPFFVGSGISSLVTFIPYASYHLKIGK
ncbi:MAG: hypothetical protein EOO39_31105 [Cytophagaceae bacterium]|nr:MAG: hypothetical protein EOO39_31105 [Cytophagaceae bacterium]